MSEAALHPYAFVLAVHDLAGSTEYFMHTLGFTMEWADEDNWHALKREDARVMLGRCPDAIAPAKLGDHSYFGYIAAKDVDALHAEFTAKSALILTPPADRPWGWREMSVATPEGHRMMFAQKL